MLVQIRHIQARCPSALPLLSYRPSSLDNIIHPITQLLACRARPQKPQVIVISKSGIHKGHVLGHTGKCQLLPGRHQRSRTHSEFMTNKLRAISQTLKPLHGRERIGSYKLPLKHTVIMTVWNKSAPQLTDCVVVKTDSITCDRTSGKASQYRLLRVTAKLFTHPWHDLLCILDR